MAETRKPEPLKLGFLAYLALAERGFVGGLLVTNHLGRPLEFQCTAPVRPNRTQEILYGPTLEPFLLCEVIGKTLLEKAAVKPTLVLIEEPQLFDLRNQVGVPVACLEKAEGSRSAEASRPSKGLLRLAVGGQQILFAEGCDGDYEQLSGQLRLIPGEADLREPFGRVRDALQETLASGAAA